MMILLCNCVADVSCELSLAKTVIGHAITPMRRVRLLERIMDLNLLRASQK